MTLHSRSSDLALKVIYIIIGTVGVLDNLFVLIIFILFIKITDKVKTRFVVLRHLMNARSFSCTDQLHSAIYIYDNNLREKTTSLVVLCVTVSYTGITLGL